MKNQKSLKLKKETVEILMANSSRSLKGGCSIGDIGNLSQNNCTTDKNTVTCKITEGVDCISKQHCSEFACPESATTCGPTNGICATRVVTCINQ